MVRFTFIVISQVFMKIWMQWSIALSSAFYRGRENIYLFSFNIKWCPLNNQTWQSG